MSVLMPPVQCVNSAACKLAYKPEAVTARRCLQYSPKCSVVYTSLISTIAILHIKPNSRANFNTACSPGNIAVCG